MTELKPSLADLALLGHYSNLLHAISHVLDKMSSLDQAWLPNDSSFQMALVTEVTEEKANNETNGEPLQRISGITHKFGAKEILAGDIHNGATRGSAIAKEGTDVLAFAITAACYSAEKGLLKIVFDLASASHGDQYAQELQQEHHKRLLARWERISQNAKQIAKEKAPEKDG
jgi:hypothetical protein